VTWHIVRNGAQMPSVCPLCRSNIAGSQIAFIMAASYKYVAIIVEQFEDGIVRKH
jgi:hypothetical protein